MTVSHRWSLVPAIVASIALGAGAAYAANAAVLMKEIQFQPATVTINVGDSVTWTNMDGGAGIPHSATADDGSFDTGVFLNGSRTVTFRTVNSVALRLGSIAYHCTVHPTFMRGTIRLAAPAPTPAPTPPPPPPPTVAPSPPPTAAPPVATVPPPTAPPGTPTPAPTPSPSPSPTATVSATVSPTATQTVLPTAVALQITASPSPTAAGAATSASRSDDGPGPLLVGAAVLGIAALAGVAVYRNRRP